MIYVVLFEDNPDRADVRAKFMPDHLAFLESNATSVQSAGPLKDAATGAAEGGLWIVTAESAAATRSLVESDPFWPTGLRRSVRVLEWTQVFRDGKRQI